MDTPGNSSAERTPDFTPGLRLSALDVVVLVLGFAGTWWLGVHVAWWAGLIVGFVVGHFFLFCNVFRIARGAELVWAAVFVLLSGATLLTEHPGWPVTITASLLLTVVLVIREMRRPSYHGIAWQRVNPQLQTWWDASMTAQKSSPR